MVHNFNKPFTLRLFFYHSEYFFCVPSLPTGCPGDFGIKLREQNKYKNFVNITTKNPPAKNLTIDIPFDVLSPIYSNKYGTCETDMKYDAYVNKKQSPFRFSSFRLPKRNESRQWSTACPVGEPNGRSELLIEGQ